MLSDFGLVAFNGLAWAMAVFIVAAGLTLVFGILHVLNFSHGGFLMIGAYVSHDLLSMLDGDVSTISYIGAALAGGVVIGVLGYFVDRFILRRLKGVEEAYSLIATYALLLLCVGAVKMIWGIDFMSVPAPKALSGALFYQGIFMPTYSMFVIGCGVALFLLLDVWIRRSRTGKLVQSVAADPWMCGLLGVNAPAMYTAVVVISFALAGFGGGLLAANQSLSPELGGHYIIQAFGVIIVGGIGNIRGAFLASVLLGLVVSFGTVYVPEYPGIFFYLAIVAILMFRPEGLIKQKGLA
tara:strand:- start:10472 stop:11359 length:888 start_codon:yes stop_codon:yes gene_type:complete